MTTPTSPVPDGVSQMHLVLDSDLADRLCLAADRRGLDLQTYVSWLMARVVLSPDEE